MRHRERGAGEKIGERRDKERRERGGDSRNGERGETRGEGVSTPCYSLNHSFNSVARPILPHLGSVYCF